MSPQSDMIATATAHVADLSNAADRMRLGPAAAHGAVRLATLWGLSSEEAGTLFGVATRTWFRMKKGDHAGVLSQDEMTRISILTGLYKALHILFSDPLADQWAKSPNTGPLYGGRTPVDVMRQGGIPAMLDVRKHIDALRGGL